MEEKLSFSDFITSLAHTVYTQLGLIENPFTKAKEKDLKSAKDTIDLINMLQEKTKNNLTEEEKKLMDETLYDIRMKYLYEMDQEK